MNEHVNEEKTTRLSRGKRRLLAFGTLLVICIVAGVVGWQGYRYLTDVMVIKEKVEAGSLVTLKEIVRGRSENTSISMNGTIDTGTLGEQTVFLTIRNGPIRTYKEIRVAVVDTKAPEISGPESLTVTSAKDFDPSESYVVDDFEKDLAKSIRVVPELDLTKEGLQEVTLKVKDSSGNVGELPVEIQVLKLSTEEEKVLTAINQYLADGHDEDTVLDTAWVMKTEGAENGVDYYVEVAENVLYALYFSGKVSEYTIFDCGSVLMHDLMVYAVHYNGTTVKTGKLLGVSGE